MNMDTVLGCGTCMVLLVVIGIIFYAVDSFSGSVKDARDRKCPYCEKLGAGKLLAKTAVDRDVSISYVTDDRPGNEGYSYRAEITKTTYEQSYRCKQCGRQWAQMTTETSTRRLAF